MKVRLDPEYLRKVILYFSNLKCNFNGPCWIYSSVGREEFKEILVFVSLWLRLNKKNIKNIGFSISAPLDIPIIHVDSQTNYQILFNNEHDYNDFKLFIMSFGDKSRLYNTLPSGSLKNITSVYCPSENADPLDEHKIITERDVEIFCWLHENCKGKFYRYNDMFFFEEESDAVYFKMVMMTEGLEDKNHV
jgi:hypothetical protein